MDTGAGFCPDDQMKKLKISFCMFRMFCIFVLTFTRKGRETCQLTDRHFLCLYTPYTAVSYPRVGECNAPAALAVKVNGKGETVRIFAQFKFKINQDIFPEKSRVLSSQKS